MHYIPGLSLRANEEAEILGIDDAEMGEFAYDYVGLEQEIGHSLETIGAREPDHHHLEQHLPHLPQDSDMTEKCDYIGLELEIGHTLEKIGAMDGAREPDHHNLEQHLPHLPQDSDITEK